MTMCNADPLTFLSPFETILWIVIVLVVFAVAPAVILLTKLTPLGESVDDSPSPIMPAQVFAWKLLEMVSYLM